MAEDHLVEGAEPELAEILAAGRHPAQRHLVDDDGVVVREPRSGRELVVPAERLQALAAAQAKHAAIARKARDLVGEGIGDRRVGAAVEHELVLVGAVGKAERLGIDAPPAGPGGDARERRPPPGLRVEPVALVRRGEPHLDGRSIRSRDLERRHPGLPSICEGRAYPRNPRNAPPRGGFRPRGADA